ncbi:phospholipid carrier-dependent glycosyltransferase [Kushneria pakistanensis]|nr:phospholipid carrier-dependent glycosyltransferase [Kushneria pakistanensis]
MKRTFRPAGWFLVTGYFLVAYLLTLNAPALWSPDELRYGEMSRELLARRDWAVPHFNGLVYFEKPIMGYWLNAFAQMLFGETNFAVRFMSALSALGGAFCIVWLVRRLWGADRAWLSGGVYLSLFIVMAVGTYSVFDSFLAFWLTVTMVAFYAALESSSYRERCLYYLLAGLGCGGAFLTKGFLALVLPLMVVVAYSLVQRRVKTLMIYGWISVTSALIVTLPWALAIHFRAPDFWHYFFWVEHIHRFLAADAQHAAPVWFFVPVLLLGLMPWTPVALPALARLRGSLASPLVRYALLWAVLPFIFFSLSRGKLATYILPCMAPLAILITHALGRMFESPGGRRCLRRLSSIQTLAMLVMALGVALGFWLELLPLDDGEGYKAGLWVLSFLVWSACLAGAARTRNIRGFFALYMLAPVAFFMLFGFALPDRTLKAKQPEGLVHRVAPWVKEDTVLVADYPTIMSAFNWYLKRDDVFLFKHQGEMEYGLSQADARHRFIDARGMEDFIADQRRHHDVVVEIRRRSSDESDLPPSDRLLRHGPYSVLFYKRSES